MVDTDKNHVLISGGSGLVGRHLSQKLMARGYSVKILSRSAGETNGIAHVKWDIEKQEIDIDAVKDSHHIIHLAGANISGGRWTDERKKVIIDSRVGGSDLLYRSIAEHNKGLRTFVSASGIGYYGQQTSQKIYSEENPAGQDFLGRCCRLWEESSKGIEALGIRRVILRTGVILASEGSALQKIVAPISFNVGSPLGSGNQIMPWVHIDDICEAYIAAIENDSMSGPYNVVSNPCPTNEEVVWAISQQLDKKLFLPNVPSFIMKLMFGEMSSILLEGSAVSNSKLLETGFQFEYSELKEALGDLLG